MKQKIIAVTIYAATAGAAAWAAGTPKIQFDQMVYDLGTTAPVKAVTGKFIFENTGDGVLQVQKPSTTCGCTVATLNKAPVNATRTSISFETNIPTQPKVEVPVMISVFTGQLQRSSAPAPVKSGPP